uniref:Acetylcholine receptor subunit alpha-like protein n=1 Tax=Ascaris suum TaxID=6253 RepID=F1LD94_ASCSU
MKFGAWSYTGYYVDLKQLPKGIKLLMVRTNMVRMWKRWRRVWISVFSIDRPNGICYRFVISSTFCTFYTSCCGPEKYVDITYYFVLRRKTLFFTCNLIVPCFLISLLTTFVFYLSDHKITFSISILVTLTVFFLVLIDIMPPTSLVIPMFGRYLITTMILVSLSTVVSVITVNFRFRSGSAHRMSPHGYAEFFSIFYPKYYL